MHDVTPTDGFTRTLGDGIGHPPYGLRRVKPGGKLAQRVSTVTTLD